MSRAGSLGDAGLQPVSQRTGAPGRGDEALAAPHLWCPGYRPGGAAGRDSGTDEPCIHPDHHGHLWPSAYQAQGQRAGRSVWLNVAPG